MPNRLSQTKAFHSLGANAGYTETNWSSLQSTSGWNEPVEYESQPNMYELNEHDATAYEQTAYDQSAEAMVIHPLAHVSSVPDAIVNDNDEEAVYVKSGWDGQTHSDSLYEEVTVEYLR